MENQNEHIRHVLLHYFLKGKTAMQAHKKICFVYGSDSLKLRQCQNWFCKFRSENFHLKDAPRSGRPVEVDGDKITALIESNPRMTTREVSETLQISKSSVGSHLKKLGFVSKLDMWLPHELKEIHLVKRIDICDSLLKREQSDPFLKRLITGDEKWIVYNNVKRRRSWTKRGEPAKTIPKAEIHQKKVMLSVWWDFKGIVFFELLPMNKTINSDRYCGQLEKLAHSIQQERPELANQKGVVIQHDNARPHTSLTTRQKLLSLGWDVLPHPPYSPDLAPSDFHLFRSLQNSLNRKTFVSDDDIKSFLDGFFAEKGKGFYESGIMKLPERWKKVIENNGQYIV